MTEFKIVPGKPWHCGSIARRLREDHAKATLALGFHDHETFAAAFAMSLIRRAWFIDGELAALGGFITSMAGYDAAVWVAISKRATEFPIALFKTAHATLAEFLATRDMIATTIVKSDTRSKAFAEHLGFVETGKEAENGEIIVMELRRGES